MNTENTDPNKRNEWLHFIGGRLYTIEKFEKEARKYGISRNLPKGQLKKMQQGDQVYCFIKSGKSALCFGYFQINGIAGELPKGLRNELKAEGKLIEPKTVSVAIPVERECGGYIWEGEITLRGMGVKDLTERVENYDKENGTTTRLMVTGTYYPIQPAIRSKIGFAQGFRPFDGEQFRADGNAWNEAGKTHAMPGYYYTKHLETMLAVSPDGTLIEIRGYAKS